MSSAPSLEELLDRKEELHPDLQFYLMKCPFGTMLHHPLMIEPIYSPMMNALFNERYKQLTQQTKECIEKKDYIGYVWRYEKPYRINVFASVQKFLDDKDYWEQLGHLWMAQENAWQNKKLWRKLLTNKRRKLRHLIMDEDDRAEFAKLKFPLKVYRGHTKSNARGYAWTLDKKRAEWFAARFKMDKEPTVSTRLATKDETIAYFGGRSEKEIVIVPRRW